MITTSKRGSCTRSADVVMDSEGGKRIHGLIAARTCPLTFALKSGLSSKKLRAAGSQLAINRRNALSPADGAGCGVVAVLVDTVAGPLPVKTIRVPFGYRIVVEVVAMQSQQSALLGGDAVPGVSEAWFAAAPQTGRPRPPLPWRSGTALPPPGLQSYARVLVCLCNRHAYHHHGHGALCGSAHRMAHEARYSQPGGPPFLPVRVR